MASVGTIEARTFEVYSAEDASYAPGADDDYKVDPNYDPKDYKEVEQWLRSLPNEEPDWWQALKKAPLQQPEQPKQPAQPPRPPKRKADQTLEEAIVFMRSAKKRHEKTKKQQKE